MRRYRRPYRIKRKKSIFKRRAFWNLTFTLILFGGLFYFFVFSEFFQVKDIVITGESRVLPENIESIVRAEIGNIFLVNPKKIKEVLLQKFPQIAELEIKKRFPDILNLALAERKEVGLFCGEGRCFLLDAQGVVFAEAAEESPLPKLQNQTLNKTLVLGEKVFDKETLDSILEVSEKLKKLGIFPDELNLILPERLNVRTLEGWEIYLNTKKDLGWQVASLATILEKSIPAEKRKELKYIDLRFDKIFIYPSL